MNVNFAYSHSFEAGADGGGGYVLKAKFKNQLLGKREKRRDGGQPYPVLLIS